MARRSLEDRDIRSLIKVSGVASYGINLPKEYIRKLKMAEQTKTGSYPLPRPAFFMAQLSLKSYYVANCYYSIFIIGSFFRSS